MSRPRPIDPRIATLAEILDVRAVESPAALAFATADERLTYRTLREEAGRIAGGLRRLGVGIGDRVAILLPAGLDVVRLFFALQRIGAVPCIFDPTVPVGTSAKRVARIRPRLVVVAEAGIGGAVFVAAGVPAATIEEISAISSPLPRVVLDQDAIAFLQPTSGTSGEPRAAVILQRNAMASLHAARELIDPGERDVMVGWVPPWHDLGLLRFLLGPVYFGIPCHLVPPAVSTIRQWFSTIAAVRGTITGAPDFAYRLATRLVPAESVDLSSLRFATSGGEPVRRSTISAFETCFGLHEVVRPGYGLAEATLGVTAVRPGEVVRYDARGNVGCGRALEGVEVRIDADDRGVTTGEILVGGPAVFAGYFDGEEASAKILRNGWLHTGDAGSLDDEGYLYVLGRRRAMLKRGGATLAPRELEEAAQSVEGVRIAAAVGIAESESMTEEVVVVVEAKPNCERIAARVSEAVERALGFAPDRVVVQLPRTIPRTANGKIQHAVLREQLIARAT